MNFSYIISFFYIFILFNLSLSVPVYYPSHTATSLHQSVHHLKFPEFSFREHPLFQDERFTNYASTLSPVIMSKYYRHMTEDNSLRNDEMLFAVGAASYSTKHNMDAAVTSLFDKLDILLVSGFGKPPSSTSSNRGGLEVHLTRPARVFVLLYGSSVQTSTFINTSTIAGLQDEKNNQWQTSNAVPVYLAKNTSDVVGETTRVGTHFRLPRNGILVEGTQPIQHIRLPHPSDIKINGNPIRRYALIFADPSQMQSIKRVPYPPAPPAVFGFAPESLSHTISNHQTPKPNTACPGWLHDLWIVTTRDKKVATDHDELSHWRSWHPAIDPVFWCYYDHEHGSYPGLHKPILGYTAWKTPDNKTTSGRQNESHEGFKIFSFTLQQQRKFVVIMAHMHLSLARRFQARHHTISVAVLDHKWNLQMELHMKMDFGAAVVTLADKTNVPMGGEDQAIIDHLMDKNKVALRRFNLLNIDEQYPTSVDNRYLFATDGPPTLDNKAQILEGIYEKWSGPLNTCMKSSKGLNQGLTFDIRNPATGAKQKSTSSPLQQLNGNSGNRMIIIPEQSDGIDIGLEYCQFDVFRSEAGVDLAADNGVFYTDPYFESIRKGPGPNSVRQFIQNGFQPLHLPAGKIAVLDSWPSEMAYGEEDIRSRSFMNPENAVLATVN